MQLGGEAEGTTLVVAGRTSLDGYRPATANGNGHSDALSQALIDFGRHVRALSDADTAAIFIQIARSIDTWLWFVETSQQAGS